MHVAGWPGDPSWGIAGAAIPWDVMTQTGDIGAASEWYAVARDNVDFFSRQGDPALDGLVSFGYYGDWLSLEAMPKPQAIRRRVSMAGWVMHSVDTSGVKRKVKCQNGSACMGQAGV